MHITMKCPNVENTDVSRSLARKQARHHRVTRTPTWWLRLIGCLGGVPMGTALTGGEPITGEEERGGRTLSDRSRGSSPLSGGGCLGRPTSLMIDMSGLSCRRQENMVMNCTGCGQYLLHRISRILIKKERSHL